MNAAAEAAELLAKLTAAGTPQRAAGERAYLKSTLHFVGSGVPAMRRIVKAWLRAHPAVTHHELLALADALWAHPVHECRLAAIELLVQRPGLLSPADIPWIEHALRDCHTWALVDPLAGWVTAELAARDPQAVVPHLDRWIHDGDFWIRRSGLLARRILLRDGRGLDEFFAAAEVLLPEREFFIRKVVGWVLRDVAARHPERVSAWLREHMAQMNLVTLREPLRRLPDAAELRALYDARAAGSRRNSDG